MVIVLIINIISFDIICYQDSAINHKKITSFGKGIVKYLKIIVQNKNMAL